jgi:hypothetical protein
MQGLSLVALAGDPSPWRLPAAALDPLVKLMGDLVAGEVLSGYRGTLVAPVVLKVTFRRFRHCLRGWW